ncbi:MAG: hypothetical protein J3K34DRAFT_512077 [Monoraphidium minutum]|nr:MAG: hypothetical protein J3K34DRAFT_512077 [Monoraphidium minutum]
MDLSGNTVLITGATSGIGLALAKRFLAAGSAVIAVGRREGLLAELAASHPGLATRPCDVGDPAQRAALRDWAVAEFPGLNVLINNAGVQRHISDLGEEEPWADTWSEVEINLGAVVHLSRLFLPHLRAAPRPAIINVTSGLAFVPKVDVPVYCATKAAVHSFTLSLRELERAAAAAATGGADAGGGSGGGGGGGVRVIEVVPPAVNTDLGGPGLHDFGAPLDEFADSVMKDLAAGHESVYFGFSGKLSAASGEDWQRAFVMINSLGK